MILAINNSFGFHFESISKVEYPMSEMHVMARKIPFHTIARFKFIHNTYFGRPLTYFTNVLVYVRLCGKMCEICVSLYE